jgi:BirA family biotin operon repressor/biotin-[acetyl-CoA-carboxylase] ligase
MTDAIINPQAIYCNLSKNSPYYFFCIEQTASTNTDLLNRLRQGEQLHGLFYYANKQLAGRGQRGKKWQSDGGLACSLVWQFHNKPSAFLSILVGIALVRALNDFDIPAKLKWPNDIYINQKKLAGILIENHKNFAVIGLGINLRQHSELPPLAVALEFYNQDINLLLSVFLSNLSSIINAWQFNKIDNGIIADWQDLCLHHNKYVRLQVSKGIFVYGKNIGIDQEGFLLIQHDNKQDLYKASSSGLGLEWEDN